MAQTNNFVTSGIPDLDRLLGGGIIIGDNVIWYDDAGLLASVFCLNLLQASKADCKHLIYLSFDCSPRHLLEKLGSLAHTPHLTILDCFTHGKGESSDLFLNFYHRPETDFPCRIICLPDPRKIEAVTDAVYDLHRSLTADVRFIFESLTGMQELWGQEETILKFYASACPRLYDLHTIAYWIAEKGAHSGRLKAHFNKITQVALDLTVKRGKTYLTVLKAEKRNLNIVNQPTVYWHQDLQVSLDPDNLHTGGIDLGRRLKRLRKQRGLSQKELARQVGVTPSNISQVENNQVYPSLPALMKIAEVFSINISYFLPEAKPARNRIIYPAAEAVATTVAGNAPKNLLARQFFAGQQEGRLDPWLIEIPPATTLNGHFFIHKGEEMGYLLSGDITLVLEEEKSFLNPGDLIHLTTTTPVQWKNEGDTTARLLWLKINM